MPQSLILKNETFSAQDKVFMARAIELAKQGHYTTTPNPRVGCVLVKNGEIIGEGYHKKAGTGHAEVNALAQAGDKSNGATAYVTLEPCSHYGRTPPCAIALIKAGIRNVIVAMVDPNPQVAGKGIKLLEDANIKTQVGLLNAESQALNIGFINLMTKHKPYVRLKLASSLDGKTAMASGESQWITSTEARQDVQRLRAQSCAIICGADSVIIDHAKMTVRYDELGDLANNYPKDDIRQPVRVIIDSQHRITPTLAIFEQESAIIIIQGKNENPLEKQQNWPHFVEHIKLPLVTTTEQKEKIDLTAVIAFLAERGFNDVLIESGATLAGAFIEQNLVDEFILFQAPKLIGAEGKSMLAMPSIEKLAEAKLLTISDTRLVGKDLRITAHFN